jgi:hypothetical protein
MCVYPFPELSDTIGGKVGGFKVRFELSETEIVEQLSPGQAYAP